MPAATSRPRVVVGGIGHLYQGDLDLGRRAAELLAAAPLGADVLVEEFSYGAVAVAQRLEELQPDRLVLIGAKERGREPGTLERREIAALPRPVSEVQAAVADAVTGYIDLDLVIDVAQGLGVLPGDTVAFEIEPDSTEPSEHLSARAEVALARALELVRRELTR